MAEQSAPHILVIQGPNLNYLGKREPEHYGTTSAAELDALIREHADSNGYRVSIFYTNTEGAALDRIYQAVEEGVDGLVMNPGAWLITGQPLKYCLKAVALPYVEVHIRNIYKSGHSSILAEEAVGVVQGFGVKTYLLGLDGMLAILASRPS